MAGVFTDANRHCVLLYKTERNYSHFVHNDGTGAVTVGKLDQTAFNHRFTELEFYDPARMAKRLLENRAIMPIMGRAYAALTAVLTGEKGTTMPTTASAKKPAPVKGAPAPKTAKEQPKPAKAPAKDTKAAKPAATGKGEDDSARRGRRSPYAGKTIKVIGKFEGREGTVRAALMAAICSSKTADDALGKVVQGRDGGEVTVKTVDLNFAIENGIIELK